MLQQAEFVGVRELSGHAVAHVGAVVPAVPQLTHHAEPLLRPVIRRVVGQLGNPEVPRAFDVGHQVDAKTVVTEVLQCRRLPRGQVGRCRPRVDGWGDPDVGCRGEQVRRQQQRVVLGAAVGRVDAQVERLG